MVALPAQQLLLACQHRGDHSAAQIGHVDRRFLLATVVFLMCIAFIPFPTRLAAEHVHGEGARAAALAYGFTLTATAVMFRVNSDDWPIDRYAPPIPASAPDSSTPA